MKTDQEKMETEITMTFSTTTVMAFLVKATEADLKRLEESIRGVRRINNS